jgi:hypothetical protein
MDTKKKVFFFLILSTHRRGGGENGGDVRGVRGGCGADEARARTRGRAPRRRRVLSRLKIAPSAWSKTAPPPSVCRVGRKERSGGSSTLKIDCAGPNASGRMRGATRGGAPTVATVRRLQRRGGWVGPDTPTFRVLFLHPRQHPPPPCVANVVGSVCAPSQALPPRPNVCDGSPCRRGGLNSG